MQCTSHPAAIYHVLLEYFAGEKPLRMSQISRKLTLCNLTTCIVFWQGLYVFTSLDFADFIVGN